MAPSAGPIQRAEMRLAWVASADILLAHLACGATDGSLLSLRVRQLCKESKSAMAVEARRCEVRAASGDLRVSKLRMETRDERASK